MPICPTPNITAAMNSNGFRPYIAIIQHAITGRVAPGTGMLIKIFLQVNLIFWEQTIRAEFPLQESILLLLLDFYI